MAQKSCDDERDVKETHRHCEQFNREAIHAQSFV
jgi:hypothetical protein